MINLILFGKPGSGKGTQAEFVKKRYNLVHISTGDVFRYNISKNTDLGLLAKSYMEKGDLVPDQVTIKMLENEVEKFPKAKGFIFDGFPRNIVQADALDSVLSKHSAQVDAMIALEVEDEILVKRLLKRGETSGRSDDSSEEIVRNRIKIYYSETAILKSYYEAKGRYHGVDGVGEIEAITERLNAVVNTL